MGGTTPLFGGKGQSGPKEGSDSSFFVFIDRRVSAYFLGGFPGNRELAVPGEFDGFTLRITGEYRIVTIEKMAWSQSLVFRKGGVGRGANVTLCREYHPSLAG